MDLSPNELVVDTKAVWVCNLGLVKAWILWLFFYLIQQPKLQVKQPTNILKQSLQLIGSDFHTRRMHQAYFSCATLITCALTVIPPGPRFIMHPANQLYDMHIYAVMS